MEPVVGELLQCGSIAEIGFGALRGECIDTSTKLIIISDKLTGMHENTAKVSTSASLEDIRSAVIKAANLGPVQSSDESCVKFASCTFSEKVPVLLTIRVDKGHAFIASNCEKMVIGSMLVKLVKESIANI